MRTIRFRALMNGEWKYYSLGDMVIGEACNDSKEEIFDSDSWCQFTGLKDKNGKEIYEGDIVKNECNYICEVRWSDEQYGGVWGWLFFKDNDTLNYYYGEGPSEGNGEVIGNIYQNPNLITK